MPFFTYVQNNSGGRFVEDEQVAHYVIIEARDAAEADRRAEVVGLYFEGCYSGQDCSCCGDRWNTAWGPGDPEPLIYDEPVAEAARGLVYVYHADGRKEVFGRGTNPLS